MNVVFLDIDGVIQSYDSNIDINNNANNIKELLTQKFGVDYSKYDPYELYDVYYNWSKVAIKRLKEILQETNARIIVSSDWRDENKPNKIKDYLKVYNLDNYWFEDNFIEKNYGLDPIKKRYMEINQSINEYPISNYVILDDMNGLQKYFPNNFVKTYDYLSKDDVKKAIRILKK